MKAAGICTPDSRIDMQRMGDYLAQRGFMPSGTAQPWFSSPSLT